MPSATQKRAKKRTRTNPHGVNQHTGPDPRQALFLAYYLDPTSELFSNGLQCALKVGYSKEYAEVMVAQMPSWLSEKLSELDLLSKAERNIKKFLDMPTRVQAMGAFGPIFAKQETRVKVKLKNGKTRDKKVVKKVPIYVENGKLLEIQQKTSHFVAERIGKARYGRPDGAKAPAVAVQVNVNADREKYAA